ncbi:MAG: MurR/RpiR family transcriptional regulator [Spirochaetales bacterium]
MKADESWAKRVENASSTLTRSEATVLDYVTAMPEEAAFQSLKELAERTGISKPKIIDLYRKLGYETFREFTEGVREFYSHRINSLRASRATFTSVESVPELIERAISIDQESLRRVSECVSSDDLAYIARSILSAGTTHLFGPGSGRYPAQFLATRLRRYRLRVHEIELDMQHLAEELVGMREGDLLLVFSYVREHETVLSVMRHAMNCDATVVVVSDNVLVDLATIADRTLYVERGLVGFKNSMAVPMSFANMVLLAVELIGGEALQQSLKDTETIRESLA